MFINSLTSAKRHQGKNRTKEGNSRYKWRYLRPFWHAKGDDEELEAICVVNDIPEAEGGVEAVHQNDEAEVNHSLTTCILCLRGETEETLPDWLIRALEDTPVRLPWSEFSENVKCEISQASEVRALDANLWWESRGGGQRVLLTASMPHTRASWEDEPPSSSSCGTSRLRAVASSNQRATYCV